MRQRQEEKRQQEETNRVKERKRKREKYAEKVLQCKEVACVSDRAGRTLGLPHVVWCGNMLGKDSSMRKAFFLSPLTINLWSFLTQKRSITEIHNAYLCIF